MVEGFGAAFQNDELEHAFETAENIRGSDANRSNSSFSQPPITKPISGGPIAEVVSGSVDLDAQSRLLTIEVEHIGPCGVLPSEFEVTRTCSKLLPKQDLRKT